MSVYSTKTGWRFDFLLNGKRYTGSGFKTKRETRREEEQKRLELEHSRIPRVTATAALSGEIPVAKAFIPGSSMT